ncbi:NADH dehydrogenase [ubiquinone] 1 beta subcomplex subunit 6 [Vulpes lagopus]
MAGYTPDEKLRLQQLQQLRRRWLKDQELSPREPVLPPQRVWPMEKFWNKFLRDQTPWKNVVSEGPPRRGCSRPAAPPSVAAGRLLPVVASPGTDITLGRQGQAVP